MSELYEQTMDREQFLKSQGYTVINMWECEFNKELKNDHDMKQFVDQLDIVSPVEERDAFFGGRTEAFNLYKEASVDRPIKYYDVTSLYPFINKTGKYVTGHQKIITENFEPVEKYEGLIKCKVLPARRLFMPVLPAKINNKLMFALCKKCTENQQQIPCQHSMEERSFIGTWVSDEIKKAIEKGYEVITIYEVWHFENFEQYNPETKTGGLFTEYINTFLKIKQEASGWPSWCVTEHDKEQYIKAYEEQEGITLQYDSIEKNPGLRSLAKLMLNSFWGKFGQRTNLEQIQYVNNPATFFDLLMSDEKEVTHISFVSEEQVEMRWKYVEAFPQTSNKVNLIVAAYTTSQARLKLYSYLEQLDRRVLYADTDSVIFESGDKDPVLGDYLGDLTDEVPNSTITQFVTGGPKNYAYKLQDNTTVCKVRGITLNYKNSLVISFATVKELITKPEGQKLAVTDNFKITRDRKRAKLLTQKQTKDYRVVFDKRVVTEQFNTLPYGY